MVNNGNETTTESTVGAAPGPDQPSPIGQLQASLADWRGRIDELLVQLDLASMEVRQAFQSELARMENARLALRSGVGYARGDLASVVPADRAAIAEALREIERAFKAARASVERR
jgi:phage shock protein A